MTRWHFVVGAYLACAFLMAMVCYIADRLENVEALGKYRPRSLSAFAAALYGIFWPITVFALIFFK